MSAPPEVISLCTGYGGLELALRSVMRHRLVAVADVDAAAVAVERRRFRRVRQLGDIRGYDWSDAPPADVLTAGYPCQPFSDAGLRRGADDPRHLWPHVLAAVRRLRPRLVLLENVAAHLRIGFDVVLADLAAIGFDAEWCVVRASDVGACHKRARLFVAAWSTEHVPAGGWPGPAPAHADLEGRQGPEREHPDGRPRPRVCDQAPADPGGPGRPRDVADVPGVEPPPNGQAAPHADGLGPSWLNLAGVREAVGLAPPEPAGGGAALWGPYAPAVARHEAVTGRIAPPPKDERGRLSSRFVEWMMMLPPGWVTDLGLARQAEIRVLGNGVVPLAGVAALRHLLARIAG